MKANLWVTHAAVHVITTQVRRSCQPKAVAALRLNASQSAGLVQPRSHGLGSSSVGVTAVADGVDLH